MGLAGFDALNIAGEQTQDVAIAGFESIENVSVTGFTQIGTTAVAGFTQLGTVAMDGFDALNAMSTNYNTTILGINDDWAAELRQLLTNPLTNTTTTTTNTTTSANTCIGTGDDEENLKKLVIELKLEEQTVNPKLMGDDELYDEDLDAETVKALSHALELDYIEKWKVFAQMKLLERNFAVAEQARVALRDQLITANANVQILLRNYEEKKIGLDHEIKEKLKVKEELKTVRAELKSLKKVNANSTKNSAKNKPEPKDA